MADRDPVPLPVEVRARLAELELELSEGESCVRVLFCSGSRSLVVSGGLMHPGVLPP